MGLMGWLLLAAGLPILAIGTVITCWSIRLTIGVRARGDVPPYGHPEPMPLPDYARDDLSAVLRRRTDRKR